MFRKRSKVFLPRKIARKRTTENIKDVRRFECVFEDVIVVWKIVSSRKMDFYYFAREIFLNKYIN